MTGGEGGAGPISKPRKNKWRSLGTEWSMSEVGTPLPNNLDRPHELVTSNNNKIRKGHQSRCWGYHSGREGDFWMNCRHQELWIHHWRCRRTHHIRHGGHGYGCQIVYHWFLCGIYWMLHGDQENEYSISHHWKYHRIYYLTWGGNNRTCFIIWPWIYHRSWVLKVQDFCHHIYYNG